MIARHRMDLAEIAVHGCSRRLNAFTDTSKGSMSKYVLSLDLDFHRLRVHTM